jgi:hypothetical protein
LRPARPPPSGASRSRCKVEQACSLLPDSMIKPGLPHMSFSPPDGVAFHIEREVPIVDLCPLLRRVVSFLQNLQPSPAKLGLFDDWWGHDGLHIKKRSLSFRELVRMIESPRSIFEATPDEHEVFVGVAPGDNRWYLRFRAEWDGHDLAIIGCLAVILAADLAVSFRENIVSSSVPGLTEEPAQSFYK